MIIKKKLLFILIGNDCTGKTTLQKLLIEQLCGVQYEKLPTNIALNIKHPEIKRKYSKISFGNRSYQEKIDKYGSIDDYFSNHFNEQKIAFISSHLNKNDLENMILNGHRKFYNVCGVFFTNSIDVNKSLNSENSAKPKRSAFKRPMLHTQTVRLYARKNQHYSLKSKFLIIFGNIFKVV